VSVGDEHREEGCEVVSEDCEDGQEEPVLSQVGEAGLGRSRS
jgi:hypothetical protein